MSDFDIIESLTELVTKNEMAYDLSGTFHLMGFNLPYHTSGKLPVPKLPGITVKKVSVTDFSWAGAALDFVLELENNNPFAVTLNGLKYDISMGGKPFITGTSQTSTSIPENGKITVDIPFDVNFIWLGKSAYDVLSGESTGYEVNGEMIFNVPGIGEKRFPFSKAGNVSLVK
ncbi:MAG: LEA type 2 family protein [Desulfobacteraceae bacterium]|nr:LEA type 2 family protein [Desulfobacteraceae bacterium]MBC2757242.1 LEA type 2 family protein [Desulfobacteraceae bacterium]